MALRAAVNDLAKIKFRKLIGGLLAIHFTEHKEETRLLSQNIDKQRILYGGISIFLGACDRSCFT